MSVLVSTSTARGRIERLTVAPAKNRPMRKFCLSRGYQFVKRKLSDGNSPPSASPRKKRAACSPAAFCTMPISVMTIAHEIMMTVERIQSRCEARGGQHRQSLSPLKHSTLPERACMSGERPVGGLGRSVQNLRGIKRCGLIPLSSQLAGISTMTYETKKIERATAYSLPRRPRAVLRPATLA